MFEVNRAEIVIVRVPSSRVVEALDVLAGGALDVVHVMPVRVELELEGEGREEVLGHGVVRAIQLDASEAGTSSESGEQHDKLGVAGEMFAKISGLASYIAALDTGGKVNFQDMKREVQRAKRSFERSLRSRTKGKVSIKIDKLERSKR